MFAEYAQSRNVPRPRKTWNRPV